VGFNSGNDASGGGGRDTDGSGSVSEKDEKKKRERCEGNCAVGCDRRQSQAWCWGSEVEALLDLVEREEAASTLTPK
jgi:hypothetical protein